MAYVSINSSQIASGEPIAQELFEKVKDNFDDHETRITNVEASLGFSPDITWFLEGNWRRAVDEVSWVRIDADSTILAVRLVVFLAGTSGTLEVDLLKKSGAGSFTSIFSVRPSVAFTDGNFAVSTNAVLITTAVAAGDFLRLDVKGVQAGFDGAQIIVEREITG